MADFGTAHSNRHFVYLAQISLLGRSGVKGNTDVTWAIWKYIRRPCPTAIVHQGSSTRNGFLSCLAPCRLTSSVIIERFRDEADRRIMELTHNGEVRQLVSDASRMRKVGSACSDGSVLYCVNLAGWGILRRRLDDGGRLSTIGLPFFQDDDFPKDVCISNSKLFLLTLEKCRIYAYLIARKEWSYIFDIEGGVRSFDAKSGSDSDWGSQFLYVVHGQGSHEIHYRRSSGEVIVTPLRNAWSCKFVNNSDGRACAVSTHSEDMWEPLTWSVHLVDLYSRSVLCTSTPFLGHHIRFMAITNEWNTIIAMGGQNDYQLVRFNLM
ncbi:hypothetical protein FOL47_011292 [Perkinsus chesapeaki]|uniref:Uncharacterized protein n=1 Tax=Perkinsus chesapeaki TaxID=330153 RepID=A0A7J6KZN4_PERCH|nr:hypothetical protein FOL47_011292 [Perkinsus chesapeaki]